MGPGSAWDVTRCAITKWVSGACGFVVGLRFVVFVSTCHTYRATRFIDECVTRVLGKQAGKTLRGVAFSRCRYAKTLRGLHGSFFEFASRLHFGAVEAPKR